MNYSIKGLGNDIEVKLLNFNYDENEIEFDDMVVLIRDALVLLPIEDRENLLGFTHLVTVYKVSIVGGYEYVIRFYTDDFKLRVVYFEDDGSVSASEITSHIRDVHNLYDYMDPTDWDAVEIKTLPYGMPTNVNESNIRYYAFVAFDDMLGFTDKRIHIQNVSHIEYHDSQDDRLIPRFRIYDTEGRSIDVQIDQYEGSMGWESYLRRLGYDMHLKKNSGWV